MFASSSDDSEVISRKVNSESDLNLKQNVSHELAYGIDLCIEWAKSNNFKKVSLQFPDSLLGDASAVALKMQKYFTDIYILADATYTSCCVDEIAAEHVKADAIIHYGNACLSGTCKLPVFYIFPQYPIETPKAAVEIKNMLAMDANSGRIVILYELGYAHAIESLEDLLSQEYSQIVISKLKSHPNAVYGNMNPKLVTTHLQNIEGSSPLSIGCRVITLPSGCVTTDYTMVYVGSDGLTLNNLMLALNGCQFYMYDPKSEKGWKDDSGNKMMLRRNYLIEKTRDATIIGILVGTLGVLAYQAMIDHIRTVATQAGKKVYTISVGKPNPAKLANFPEIEVFVYVACPESTLLDCKEYYRPIVTPYEFQVAHNPGNSWSGQIITDFEKVLSDYVSATSTDDTEKLNVSLITGGIQRVILSEPTAVEGNTLMERNDLSVAQLHRNGAGEFLAGRTWQGLNPLIGQTPTAILTEGQHGVASYYEKEAAT